MLDLLIPTAEDVAVLRRVLNPAVPFTRLVTWQGFMAGIDKRRAHAQVPAQWGRRGAVVTDARMPRR